MQKNALRHYSQIEKKLRGKRVVILLDFDGTLAPIAKKPALARMQSGMRKALETAASAHAVGIVSGRRIEDLARLIGMPQLAYSGNHGLRWRLRGKPGMAAISKEGIRALAAARARLKKLPRTYHGVIIEDKKISIAVHYRLAKRRDQLLARGKVVVIVAEQSDQLRAIHGNKALEILPTHRFDKGTASRMFAERLGGRNAMPIFIGDDETDEFAFRALKKKGIGIRVGRRDKSAAAYYVPEQKDVEKFLLKLSALS